MTVYFFARVTGYIVLSLCYGWKTL